MTRLFDSDERYAIIRKIKDTLLFNSISLIDIEFQWSQNISKDEIIKWNIKAHNKILISNDLRKLKNFNEIFPQILFVMLQRKLFIKHPIIYRILNIPLIRIFLNDYFANIIASVKHR